MRSFISISIVTLVLLIMLGVLFFIWNPTSDIEMTAAVVSTPTQVTDSTDARQVTTTLTETEFAEPAANVNNTRMEDATIATKALTETTVAMETTPAPAPASPSDLASLLHSMTNTSRARNNLNDLMLDPSLSALAKARSEEMASKNYFSHTSPSGCDLRCRFTKTNYETMSWGENLAESDSYNISSSHELADIFIGSWLKSSGHRENILSAKFTHEGIGIATNGKRVVVTVIFAAP